MSRLIDGVDYGPLTTLLGRWIGTRGIDVAPDADGQPDRTKFTDELEFIPSGPAENAEEQELVSVRYHHVVRKEENGKIFHDQIGHWIYEPGTGLIMLSLSIPRAVAVLAGGQLVESDSGWVAAVKASAGASDFGIVQSPFMLEKAKTRAFEMTLTVGDEVLSYEQTTYLHIYGVDFDHIDKSLLRKVSYDQD
jgi:hypothetical protein